MFLPRWLTCPLMCLLLVLVTVLACQAAPQQIGTVTMPFTGTVSAGIYQNGQLVRTLYATSSQAQGPVALNWDGRDDWGFLVPSGTYEWRAITSQAVGVDDGSVGELATPTYGKGEHSNSVFGVAVDAAGNLYQVSYWEETHYDLRKWNADGTPAWGNNFVGGAVVAVDATYVYAARDVSGENRIERFKAADGAGITWPGAPDGYIKANASGGNGVFGLAVDATRLWVSNSAQNRIELYDKATGAFLSQFPVTAPRGIVVDGAGNAWICHSGTRVTKYSAAGQPGSEITGLQNPYAVAIGGPNTHLYIAEVDTGKVLEYDPATLARVRALFGAAQPGPVSDYAFYWPWVGHAGIAVDAQGRITVTDDANHRVMRYQADGTFWEQHFSEFQPAPCTDPTVDPNMLLSTWVQYAVDYTPGANYGKWRLTHNWRPTDGQYYSASSVRRKLANGKDYLFYFGTAKGITVYALEPTGMRRCALIGGDNGLYNWTDTNGNGVIEDSEKVTAPGSANYSALAPGWWIDNIGNAWIASWSGATVCIPLDGFDAKGNPLYDWTHRQTVVAKDTTRWDFTPTNLRIDPVSGEIYRIGTTAYNRDIYGTFWMGGTAIERRAANGTRVSVFPIPAVKAGNIGDVTVVVATDSDGNYFYTGHSYNDQHFVRMFTNDGLQVCVCRMGAPSGFSGGWMDHGLSLTAFTHPDNGVHYIYAEEVYYGKSIRYRIDNLETLTRSQGTFTWTAEKPTVTIQATDATAAESGKDPGSFTITRDSVTGPLTVNYTLSGTAAVDDYTPTLGTSVTIPDGKNTAVITITPKDDSVQESAETVILTITPNAAYTVGTPDTATVTILDNDVTVTVAATDATAAEAGTDPGVFTLTRNNTAGELTVKYALSRPPVPIVSATASSSANNNYLPGKAIDGNLGTLWMSTGNSTNQGQDDAPYITFQFDQVYTLREMRLSNYNTGEYQRGVKDVEVKISTDGLNFTSIGIKHISIGKANLADAYFQAVDLGNVQAKYVMFDIKSNWYGKTFDQGTSFDGASANASITGVSEVQFYQPGATADDYRPVSGSVTFADGQGTATVTITPVDDTVYEGDEALTLSLVADPTYTIGTPGLAQLIILDNEQVPPTVTIAAAPASVKERLEQPGVFTVTRTGTAGDLTVRYTMATQAIPIVSAGASSWANNNYIPAKAYDDDPGTLWMSAGNSASEGKDDTPYITFTFDRVYNVGRMRVSNYNTGEYNRGMKDVEVFVSTDGVNFTSIGMRQFKRGSATAAGAFYEDFELGGVPALRVMLDVKTNYYGRTFDQGTSYDGQYANRSITGVSEVRFFASDGITPDDLHETLTGTVTIPDGQSSATITVTPVNDGREEGDETLTLTLLDTTAYLVGTPSSATMTIIDYLPLSGVTLQTSPAYAQPVHSPVTLSAAASGGDEVEYLFRVGYKDDAGKWHWTDVQPYSAATSCTWTPTLSALYTVVVFAREVGTETSCYKSAYFRVTSLPPTAVTLTIGPAAPQSLNTPITLSAQATGPGEAEYQFRAGYKDATGTWHWETVRAYGKEPTCTWTPTVAALYTVAVYAREVGGAVGYRVYASTYYKITSEPPTAVTLTASPKAVQPVNTLITLTAQTAGGGAAEYRFRVGFKDAYGTWHWTDLSGYSQKNTCTWRPTISRTYTLVVYAREVCGSVSYRAYATLIYLATEP